MKAFNILGKVFFAGMFRVQQCNFIPQEKNLPKVCIPSIDFLPLLLLLPLPPAAPVGHHGAIAVLMTQGVEAVALCLFVAVLAAVVVVVVVVVVVCWQEII